MAAVLDPIGLELPPVPDLGKRRTLLVGTLLAIASGTVLIGALLGGYLHARDLAKVSDRPWPPEGLVLPNVALFVIFIGLVISAFTAHWAYAAIKMDDRRQAYLAVASTIGLGLLFVNGMSFCWTRIGLGAGSSDYATFMYAVSVTHVLIVIAAVVAFVVLGFRVLGGQFSPRNRESIAAAVAFWDFAVVIGLVVWWILWFVEGGPG